MHATRSQYIARPLRTSRTLPGRLPGEECGGSADGRSADGIRKNLEAGDGIRTHDNHVGNVVLYQLSYTRGVPQKERSASRPGPTGIGPRSPGTPRL